MNSVRKSALALLALIGAFYLSISYRFGEPGWRFEVKTRPASARGEPVDDYDLGSLSVLNRVVILIKENYVDPDRINERKMIGAAMEEVQKAVAELLIETEKDDTDTPIRVTVRLNGAEEVFDLGDVDNLWQMSFRFKDILRFVQKNLRHFKKLRDVEYAAVDGILSTLDPHSVLLRPEDYREMKLSTRGKFGGLGIVISIREGRLTIVNPIPDTPASKAGLRTGDQIVRINYDSTVNMALNDAVDMLRGAPNTKVDIWVVRDAWKKPRKFTLTRDNIKIKSVAFKLLPGKVGLVRIRNFQNTTYNEVRAGLARLRKKARTLRGVVLDLRDNPGGLLDQAIKVADMFVESGPIVTTVGVGDKLREPKMATRTGTEDPLPLVVLTNMSSASASEIVAGALKNHRRALTIGQQTFGKGSVQVIYDNKDDSALKLTIAQYLTPGDVSIQSVGIVPDVQTKPVVLSDETTDFYRSEELKGGEKDLPAHLDHESANVSRAQKPAHRVRYLQDPELVQKIEENPNDIVVDFEISLAREIIVQGSRARKDALLAEVDAVLKRRISEEEAKIIEALGKRGVDWSATSAALGKPRAELMVTTSAVDNDATAGEKLIFDATVRNVGDAPFSRLRALSRSENGLFEGLEFLFGNIAPGESRSWKVPVNVPKSALTRRDAVTLEFQEANSHVPATASVKVGIAQLERPRFALTYRIDDSRKGNGDGLLQRGEAAELLLDVRNVGVGQSFSTLAALKNSEEDRERTVFIERGRVNIDGISPGEQKQVRFTFKVKQKTPSVEVPVAVMVMDTDIREATAEKFVLAVADADGAHEAGLTTLVIDDVWLTSAGGKAIPCRGTYVAGAPVAMTAVGVLRADARMGGWYRVPVGEGVYVWASEGDVREVDEASTIAKLELFVPKGPPVITFNGARPVVETRYENLPLSGKASGEDHLKDLFIFVNNKKVFFKSNPESGDHENSTLLFSTTVPLKQGVNRITVVAREDEHLSSRQTVIVNRDP